MVLSQSTYCFACPSLFVAAAASCSCYFFEILLQAATYGCGEKEHARHMSPETSIWIFTGVSILWEGGGKVVVM